MRPFTQAPAVAPTRKVMTKLSSVNVSIIRKKRSDDKRFPPEGPWGDNSPRWVRRRPVTKSGMRECSLHPLSALPGHRAGSSHGAGPRTSTDRPDQGVAATEKPFLSLGAYDPKRQFASSPALAVEHVFVSWVDPYAAPLLEDAVSYAKARGRWMMVVQS